MIIGIISAAFVLVMTGASVWEGIKTLGTPHDRSAGNETLRHVAALLGGRFQEREEFPRYWRPPQYGGVDGELDGLRYELRLMPWNAEDCGGSARLRIQPHPPGAKYGSVFFTPEHVWHWPDLADPGTLADYVRQAIASVAFGGVPPETR